MSEEHLVETPSEISVAVIGAGTMGSGIAQLAAVAGHRVFIIDAVPGAATRAIDAIVERVARMNERGQTDVKPESLLLTATNSIADIAAARYVIEAVVEDLAVKQHLFEEVESIVESTCVLATNTSSLSPTGIAAGLKNPERFVGLHFFNPAPVMRLVEVVPGLATTSDVVERATELAQSWGKTVVTSTPTPGFIVNRIARPFYAEGLRLVEERSTNPAVIDAVMTGAGGFRMGPFELMDLIGLDINEAATRSVWSAFGNDPRFAPSIVQHQLVTAGWLGRKAGRGFYDYSSDPRTPSASPCEAREAPNRVVNVGASSLDTLLDRSGVAISREVGEEDLVELPSGVVLVRCTGRTANELAHGWNRAVVVVDRALDDATATAIAIAASDSCPPAAVDEAVGLLQSAALDVYRIEDAPGMIVTRTVAMLVNVASDALQQGVASAKDIDVAMRLGTNYPLGPFEWAERWGIATIADVLDALQASDGTGHYRPSSLLRRVSLSGRSFN